MRITVVGDVLLDVDINGSATRLSPDAPVPVVDVGEIRRRAGGAGLVATVLARDGHSVSLVTALSDDDGANHLRRALSGVSVLAGAPLAPTPTKTRVRIGTHPMVRFDEGCAPPPVPLSTGEMLAAIASAEAIVVADYGRGITANTDIRAAIAEAVRRVPVVWDPHPAGSEPVEGVAVVTPNLAEALAAAKAAGLEATPTEGGKAGAFLLEKWQSKTVLVTRGEDGALLFTADTAVQDIPAPSTNVSDPCGAGDRLAGSLAVHLGRGLDHAQAAARAVEDASAFLAQGGAAALADPPEVGDAAEAGPVVELKGLELVGLQDSDLDPDGIQLAKAVRASGGTVVATGGCFDLLHAGHARTLAAARSMGDCLIVCLNSDESVRRLKGMHRPIVSAEDRAELLLALECVDAVVLFGEDTPESCLAEIRPDIWVKGGDYAPEDLPEARLLAGWGGRCVTVPFHPARSTSGLAAALAKVS
ncbi:rfaE bifunctional protein nucleotidyltransferase chain/domain/rfaE bifunctional protein kinase chain/domain [Paenarthrobacter nitroguajacolicus]|uniref:PfkB family carbohydrate kinase n=1 Tax=Paenarthrobacter nitroguajacolicus TaxID=211146 RepID=UPI0028643A53|nr:PfkB family carbohydrate kinase [Paenarthrobacter nitroguajacolicus]MDR6988692.1 rfaE bifunctional protein nucleotidyltransferase chain/domain/rfaE bifunctional protein kinase chain/domain [Paenarthrobacter nitroguajacolicus]